MKLKRRILTIIVCIIFLFSFSTSAMASGIEKQLLSASIERASGSFSMEVAGNTLLTASTSFPLEAGEEVTIKASYSPFSANVDFGLIAPDGYFYYLSTENGSFNKTIRVSERGNYTLAVRNNSTQAISVSGYVKY